jgi:hypothetical protein
MWPRFCEMLLGAWLIVSPLIFYAGGEARFWVSDMICGGLLILLAGLSLLPPLSRLHLAELLVALWLLGFGYLADPEPLAGLQNNILTALVLPMFAIVPTAATSPPDSWRELRE